MVTKEMKQELIEKIKSTEDENTLVEIYRILQLGTQEVEMIVLSNEQKKLIDEGIEDIEKGNYLSDNEIEEWLKK